MADTLNAVDNEARLKEAGPPRIRRRNRMITSCLECRRRKLKCDKLQPCTNCNKFSRECMFLAPALDSVSQKKLNELKDKMGSLEKVLENDIARRGSGSKMHDSANERRSPGDLPGEGSGSDDETTVPEDEKPLEATPLAVSDAAYEDTASEDLLDLGVRIGRMRLTERFGGTFRPRFADELASALGEPINTDMSDPNVRRLSDHEDFLAPGPTFIAPGSGFIFGDVGPRRNLIDFLPSKNAADTLVQKYYQKVHFIARVVHWPSFQLQYESFWNNVLSGYEPSASLQAVVFAVMFAAIASMNDEEVYAVFGSGKTTVQTGFQTATEVALGKAHFLRTTKVETLQALVIYLIPMCREEISRAHSVLVGSAMRLAECMGLHRDPEIFGMSPIGTHVRRILWFQLCYLDFRTAETQAPRTYIKREDYDTRFPLDINDVDLMAPEPKERGGVWTDMTLSRMRFECVEMWRIIAHDTTRVHQKRISITHALGKVQSFRQAMEKKYIAMLDASIPIQSFAKHFLQSAMQRMQVTILHRFHHSVHKQIPDRLREILINSAIEAMENFIACQSKPEFAEWRWMATSITTWNPAMLLLLEIFAFPQRREADRIFAILDFVYQPDLQLSREQKARQILATIRDRAAFYRDMRHIREPVGMPSRQSLSLPLRGAQSMPGPEAILLKKEEPDSPTSHGPLASAATSPSRNGSISMGRSASLNGQDDSSLMNRQQAQRRSVADAWTFDSQTTLFQKAPRPDAARGTTPKSRVSSASPTAPANTTLPQRMSVVSQPQQQSNSNLPGLEYGNSPSASSSNTDTWPPSLSNDNGNWSMGSPPSTQHQHEMTSEQAMPFGQPGIGQAPHMYMPNGFTTSSLPFIANGPGTMESVLQQQGGGPAQDDPMSLEIDWGEWDKIFPPDVNTGNLDHPQAVNR